MLLGFVKLTTPLAFNSLLCILLVMFTYFVLKLEKMGFRDIGVAVKNTVGIRHLPIGFVIGTAMLLITAVSIKTLTDFTWVRNEAFDIKDLSLLFVTVFFSVVVQELAFRGYPFRILLDKWGIWPAQFTIAILFGCMHLHENMSLNEILLTMLTTGAGSLLFGMTVVKTGLLHFAVGIHFGWNFLQVLLPRHPSQNGEGILLVQGGQFETNAVVWVMPYFVVLGLTYFSLSYWLNSRER